MDLNSVSGPDEWKLHVFSSKEKLNLFDEALEVRSVFWGVTPAPAHLSVHLRPQIHMY